MYPNKIKIASGVNQLTQMNLQDRTIFSINFGQIVPVSTRMVYPRERYKLDLTPFARIAPLAVPTYGQASMRFQCFYVPYYQLGNDIESFLSGNKYHGARVTALRKVRLSILLGFFQQNNLLVSSDVNNYHFHIIQNATDKYYKLNDKGQYYYKILRGCGYAIPKHIYLEQNGNLTKDYTYNALPLLAFFKAYNDILSSNLRYSQSLLTQVLEQVKDYDNQSNKEYINVNGLTQSALKVMFENLYLLYDSDLFTSAWKYPNSPFMTINETIDNGTLWTGGRENVDVKISQDATETTLDDTIQPTLNTFQLKALRAIDTWLRRRNYAGSRPFQQVLANFGIKPSDYKANYAHNLGRFDSPLQIGDVTNTGSNSTTNPLGSYAGKGIISGDGKFEIEVPDYGQLIVVAYVYVNPMYYQGVDKDILRLDPLDFYNPDFDALGPEPISYQQLIADKTNNNAFDKVFGFTERYNDLKVGKDRILGDFNYYKAYNSWHFGREFPQFGELESNPDFGAQNPDIIYYDQTESEFNRVFSVRTGEKNTPDHFYCVLNININKLTPMKSIAHSSGLPEGNIELPTHGQTN